MLTGHRTALSQANVVSQSFAEFVDIYPTLADLAGNVTHREPVDLTPMGGQFDFARPSARTMHPHVCAYDAPTCGALDTCR